MGSSLASSLRTKRSALISAEAGWFAAASEGILLVGPDQRTLAANPAALALLGWHPRHAAGRPLSFLEDPKGDSQTLPEQLALMWQTARDDGMWRGELWCQRDDGERFAAHVGLSSLPDPDQGWVMVLTDITRLKQDEERSSHQANYDSLTGLPNRALFLDRLGQAVHHAERYGQMVGLMFVDLDGFKLVNDTLGHDVGDLLLQEAAVRLSHCIRLGDTVARLGGDEFTVLMPNLGACQNAPTVAQRILDALKKPFMLHGREAYVSASIGITVFPDDAADASSMLKNADAAMYRAKDQGKANFQFFTADMNAAAEERLAIKTGLSRALEQNELSLVFQPKLALATGRVSGVEALLRWTHADLGTVPPSKFIPVMEESGLMGAIGEWALEAACRQHRRWLEDGLSPVRIAVNLSGRQLRQPGFVRTVETILARTGVSAAALEFEITEGMILKDANHAIATLTELAAMGIRLAMDDFGTGYSSLTQIKRFPVESLKIDRSFTAELASNPDDLELARTIISMGHSLKRRIVAEGVESQEQVTILRTLGCDEIQGYALCPPLPADRVVEFLLSHPNIHQ